MNRISKLQNILRTGTAGRVDNTVVDTFTAALILKKYKSLTAKSKAKFAALTVDKMVEVQTKKKSDKIASNVALNANTLKYLYTLVIKGVSYTDPLDLIGVDVSRLIENGIIKVDKDQQAVYPTEKTKKVIQDWETERGPEAVAAWQARFLKNATVKKTAINWGTDQAKYWAAVKSDAETIAEGLRDGSIDDQGEAVHEAADSAVTYTMDALGILIHSNNDDAMFDEGVGDLKGVQSASDVYTKLAYWAYVADLNEAISRLDTTSADSDVEEE